MKHFNKIFFLLFFVSISLTHSQGISDEYKQELINSLSIIDEDSSRTMHYGCNAIDWVIEYEIVEAIPTIIENIWKQEGYCQTRYLTALEVLGAEETESIALAFLDSVDTYATPTHPMAPTKLELKISAVRDLFDLGNYTKYQIVFDRIDEAAPKLEYGAIFMLPEIIWHYPEHEERAKNELIKFAYESDDDTYKSYAVSNIDTVYGKDMIDVYLDVFSTADSYGTRLGILNRVLSKYKSQKVNEVLRQKLSEDSFGYNRYEIARHLLEQYGSISDYIFVKDYIPNENEDEYSGYMVLDIQDFRSPKPNSTTTTATMLDTLISYTNQSYNYEWITNKGIYNSLSKKLENAKKDLEKGKANSTKNIIQAYQNEVVAQNEKHITEDGYKFLYYFSDYIIERLQNGE